MDRRVERRVCGVALESRGIGIVVEVQENVVIGKCRCESRDEGRRRIDDGRSERRPS